MSVFKVSSSSNLLESNNHWKLLKNSHDLKFGEYGDITSELFKKDESGLILIIFLEDLIEETTVEEVALKERYYPLLKLIEKKAKASKQPIVICFGSNLVQSPISTAKEETDLKKVYNWFKEKFSFLRDKFSNIYYINLSEIFCQHGLLKMYSQRNWYFSRCRVSIDGLKVLTDTLALILNRMREPASKVIALDCDNTIWGGVVGEDGLKNLILGQDGIGQAFIDFQKEIVRLSNNGLIVVLVSKNNKEDVWKVFDEHNEMILKRENIVIAKINWEEKAYNIEQIASELDLDINSFVFWDDNPLERDKMKTLMPQVLTVDVPKSVIEWPTMIRKLDNFAKFQITTDDKKKTEHYKSQTQFKKGVIQSKNLQSYLGSLNLSAISVALDDANISRAEQMCLKTNQFNLRTKRHTAAKLTEFYEDNEDYVFLVRLSDIYADHGIVGLVCLKSLSSDVVFLDTLLMSCRVLGRHLEAWILSEIIQRIKKNKKKYLLAEFIDTGKNKISKKFLETYGFKHVSKKNQNYKINCDLKKIQGTPFLLQTDNVKIPNIELFNKND